MFQRFLMIGFLIGQIAISLPALAGTNVLEGDEAKAMYEKLKGQSNTLKQVNTTFTLVAPGGEETEKPEKLSLKVGEYLFITNNEDKVVHNVYDQSDHSWVLKKQEPGGYAAISFAEPGVHDLRCAIHPKMKISVSVVQ